jgi:ribosomal 50S subunit-recycling heat shock protein
MRVDLALKYMCLAKSRSAVKALCDQQAVFVNDHPAKPSATLRVGDSVRIVTASGALTIALLNIPEKQLSKATAPTYYRVISPAAG